MSVMDMRPSERPGQEIKVSVDEWTRQSEIGPDEQREHALARANGAKRLIGQFRAELGLLQPMEGRAMVAHVLVHDFERFPGMRLDLMLCSIKHWGPEKCRRLCFKAGVSELATVRELSVRQRAEIGALLTEKQHAF